MNNETDIDVQYVSPLKKICMTIGELPSSYLETMSYYEMLVWFTEYLKNTIIPTINNNAEAVQELQSLYEELRTYVNDYFDNLDVQEEINNKLDDMDQDGSLTNLIKNYVDPIYQSYEEEINSDISSFKQDVNTTIGTLNTKVDSLSSGSPLVASSTSDMTNTERTYVNTTDGNWYYYDGDSWEIGGVYQSSGIADNSITMNMLDSELKDVMDLKTISFTPTEGKYISSSGNMNNNTAYNIIEEIQVKKGQTIKLRASVLSNQCAIGKKIRTNKYLVLVLGTGTPIANYSYTATEDMTIGCTYKNDSTPTLISYVKEKTILDVVNNKDDSLQNQINNITDYEEITYTPEQGKYITGSGNVSNQADYNIIRNIALKKNQTIEFTGFVQDNVCAIGKKTGETTYNPLVLGETGNLDVKKYSYTATEDMTVGISYLKTGLDNPHVYISNDVGEIINEIMDSDFSSRDNILTMFSNITCIGDSLTYCEVYYGYEGGVHLKRQAYRTWPEILGVKTGANIETLAKGGKTPTTWWSEFASSLTAKENQLCIIFLGNNDGLTDTVDTDCVGNDPDNYANTNTGYYGRIIKTCQNNGANVLLIKMGSESGIYAETNQAIESLSTRFNVPYVINPATNYDLSGDLYHYWPNKLGTNSHYNDLGYTMFGEILIKNISNMSEEFIEMIYPQ